MKVITWNMGFWQYKNSHNEAWKYLKEEINPDIALLQETYLPHLTETENLLYRSIGGTRKWGSAIYSRDLPIREIIFDSFTGWVVACEVSLPNDRKIIIVSIHAQIVKGYVFPNLTNIFDALSPILENREFIIGGDFNSCRLIDKVQKTKYHTAFFDKIETNGFFNCHQKFHEVEQQTFWGKRTKQPYQDDHLFVSDNLAEKVISCDVLGYEPIKTLSDHTPVLLGIKI